MIDLVEQRRERRFQAERRTMVGIPALGAWYELLNLSLDGLAFSYAPSDWLPVDLDRIRLATAALEPLIDGLHVETVSDCSVIGPDSCILRRRAVLFDGLSVEQEALLRNFIRSQTRPERRPRLSGTPLAASLLPTPFSTA